MEIFSPLSGVVLPLASIPDPVFATGLAGDGLAIDPTSDEVLAPIAGRVSALHRARHAITITSADGLELLIHVGLDTVRLGGHGFHPLVSVGEGVARGQPVLRFDADQVARGARSLITVVLATNGTIGRRLGDGRVVAGTSSIFDATRTPAAIPPAHAAGSGQLISRPIVLTNASGLHARPAAILAQAARAFTSELRLLRGDDEADLKSVVSTMGLSTVQGDEVRVQATGSDAREAVAALEALLASGSGESKAAPPPVSPARPAPSPGEEGVLRGVPASPGIAVGPVLQYRHAALVIDAAGGSEEEERRRYFAARGAIIGQLDEPVEGGDPARAAILGVQRAMLDDPELQAHVEAQLLGGRSAAAAWQDAFTSQADRLERLESKLLRERAVDVRDLGRRLLSLLVGGAPARLSIPPGSILVAAELTPSETAALDPTQVAGFCTTTGGSTSHVAIMARSLGIPAICGIDEAALSLAEGGSVILDGTAGTLRLQPGDAEVAAARARLGDEGARRAIEASAAQRPARTSDGLRRIEVAANIRTLDDARAAMAAGADGVGLLRSEFLFADRQEAPGEDEQAQAYRAIARSVGPGQRLVVRTLDVGGDKALPYLPIPPEANPFLGMRGIRVSLDHPELFRTQIRAILRAAPDTDLHVMFPMVAGLEELRAALAIFKSERGSDSNARVGVMVEVPSAAIMADVLAREVDFFSIGTNDLTQYTLAVDRGHPKLASRADALDPAVLRMIAQTVAGARRYGRWVGVCGGIASDPVAIPILVGLGIDELSVSVPAIASVKAAVRRWSEGACIRIAAEAIECETAAEVRALLAHAEALRVAGEPSEMGREQAG